MTSMGLLQDPALGVSEIENIFCIFFLKNKFYFGMASHIDKFYSTLNQEFQFIISSWNTIHHAFTSPNGI